MIVTLDDIISEYIDNNKKSLCGDCQNEGKETHKADLYTERDTTCDDCYLVKNADGDYTMDNYYDGGM